MTPDTASDRVTDIFRISLGVRQSLNQTILRELRMLSVPVIIFYSIYIIYELITLPTQLFFPILTNDIAIVVSFTGINIALKYDKVAPQWANLLAMCLGGIILINALTSLYILDDPFLNVYMLIIIIGISYFMLSFYWWAITIFLYICAWLPVSLAISPQEDFANNLFSILAGVLLSATIQMSRLRNFQRIEKLRFTDHQQKVELEEALESFKNEVFERKKTEEEKHQLEDQLRQTQKMDAIERLAGGIAHDMNNVLGAIMSTASIIKSETENDDRKKEDIENILVACRRGNDLTQNLLGFARKGKYISEIFSINDIVKRTEALLERTFPKKIVMVFQLDETLDYVSGDKGQIEHALMNICINALDAMKGEGKLTFSTENLSLNRKQAAESKGLSPGKYVKLTVTDTGEGMGLATQERAFEPFFTTKPKGKGTGLGLSMVHGTIKNHGGNVIIDSPPYKGTTITFLLPAASKKDQDITTSKRQKNEAHLGSGSVMVVDDEEIVRKSTTRLLERLGYTVLVAEDGNTAIEIYGKQKEEISLVILDQIMPQMDGKETFRHLQKIDPNVKVLLCSGYLETEDIRDMMSNGATGFLRKPFDLAELSNKIEKSLSIQTHRKELPVPSSDV